LTCITVFLLLTTSYNIAVSQKTNDESYCYGFIIPLPQGEDTTIETFENSKVRHLINDLLREKINVYWITDDITILTKDTQDVTKERFFEKGAFIIPFSKEQYTDSLIISIIHDYNYSCEIQEDEIKIKSFFIMEPLTFEGYKLEEVKIAQHLGLPVRYSWPCYLLIADAGGFLTFEFLDDFETAKYLNNEDFNVFMWPYEPEPSTYIEIVRSLSDVEGLNSIRNFVKNGGGYIGSCYGAQMASSNVLWPLPLFFLRRFYNPDLKYLPITTLSLSDTFIRLAPIKDQLYITTSKIDKPNHPLSYGLNNTVKEFFQGGWYKWVGKNTKVIGHFSDIVVNTGEGKVPIQVEKSLVKTPSHLSTSFGNGKVVLFAAHPEYVINISILLKATSWEGDKYYGRRTIFNALNFVTTKQKESVEVKEEYPLCFVTDVIDSTDNLEIHDLSSSEFDDLILEIYNLKEDIQEIINKTNSLKSLFSKFDNKYKIFEKGRRHLGYMLHYSGIYDDFLNRSLTALEKLELIYPMYSNINSSIYEKITLLKNDLEQRIQNASKIFEEVFGIADSINNIFEKKRINILDKLKLINNRRKLISTYELNLKYIPQLLFNPLKILRNFWYNYEAEIATNNY